MLTKISKNLIKMACTSALITGAMIALPIEQANAAGVQTFTSLTYFNPADMDFVDNFKFTVGGGFVNVRSKFTGTHLGVSGTSKSNRDNVFPYGQIIYRIPSCHKKLVIGFDVSNPGLADLKYKSGNLAGTESRVISRNYSPKVSYQILDKLTLGFGLDILYGSTGVANFQATPAPNSLILKNKGHGSSFGWDAGFLWKVLPITYISGSYHSKHKLNYDGYSQFGTNITTTSLNVPLPDTFSLNYLQILSKEWLVNFNAKYMLWKDVYKSFIVRNAATPGGTLIFPLNYKNSWMGQIYSRYHFAEKWAGVGFVEYDSNPQPKAFRPIEFPADQLWFFGLGLQYMPTKNIETQLLYGFAYSNPGINNIQTTGRTVGKDKIKVNLVDLRITYKF